MRFSRKDVELNTELQETIIEDNSLIGTPIAIDEDGNIELLEDGESALSTDVTASDKSETVATIDYTEQLTTLNDSINALNGTCVTILGFVIFAWIEEKLRLGIRRMFTNGKSD